MASTAASDAHALLVDLPKARNFQLFLFVLTFFVFGRVLARLASTPSKLSQQILSGFFLLLTSEMDFQMLKRKTTAYS